MSRLIRLNKCVQMRKEVVSDSWVSEEDKVKFKTTWMIHFLVAHYHGRRRGQCGVPMVLFQVSYS